MAKATINGKKYQGFSIVIRNGMIIVDGKPTEPEPKTPSEYHVKIDGVIGSLETDGNVTVLNGIVRGNVCAGGDVTCTDINGDVQAAGDVQARVCNGKSLQAGGNITITGKAYE